MSTDPAENLAKDQRMILMVVKVVGFSFVAILAVWGRVVSIELIGVVALWILIDHLEHRTVTAVRDRILGPRRSWDPLTAKPVIRRPPPPPPPRPRRVP